MTARQQDSRPAFLITIDTEGDNLWEATDKIETRNAAYLPRFQALCERYGFKPTWLTNYEMATDPTFIEFGRDVLKRGQGEIGMHLHAWNSPPIKPLTDDDYRHRPYLIEYPDDVMRDKIAFMTHLLEDTFGVKMLSHRAGRWAFDERYARMLLELGYKVDCSVTPGISWNKSKGNPEGNGGADYTLFQRKPYRICLNDISKEGASELLEVPMTIWRSVLYARLPWVYGVPIVGGVAHRYSSPHVWLRPMGNNIKQIMKMVEVSIREKSPHLEFMLHSSELMPGGSPTYKTVDRIEQLYRELELMLQKIKLNYCGMTLAEFSINFQSISD